VFIPRKEKLIGREYGTVWLFGERRKEKEKEIGYVRGNQVDTSDEM